MPNPKNNRSPERRSFSKVSHGRLPFTFNQLIDFVDEANSIDHGLSQIGGILISLSEIDEFDRCCLSWLGDITKQLSDRARCLRTYWFDQPLSWGVDENFSQGELTRLKFQYPKKASRRGR